MFEKITKRDKRTTLEKEIDEVIKIMGRHQPDSKEYTTMADNLVKLQKANEQNANRKVKWDTIWTVGGSLGGIALMLWHERANIITTKALGFILKGRV